MLHSSTRNQEANQKLPPDLVDNIIDFCNDDKETLFSLTLVCKSWLPLIQSRLFDRICIKPPTKNKRCDKTLDNSALVGYIQHVALNLYPDKSLHGNEEDEVKYLLKVVNQIKNSNVLKSLSIWLYHRPNFAPYRQLLESLSSGSFTNTVELNIYFGNLQEISIEDIIRFICSFPHLHTLCMDCCELGGPSDSLCTDLAPVARYHLPTSLRVLHAWVPSMPEATNYLDKWFSSQSPGGVLDLSISMTPSLKFSSHTASCSRNLRTLTICLYPESRLPGINDCDLSSFLVLESLTVVNPSRYHHFHIIHHMLQTITSSRIRKFRFQCFPFRYDISRVSRDVG